MTNRHANPAHCKPSSWPPHPTFSTLPSQFMAALPCRFLKPYSLEWFPNSTISPTSHFLSARKFCHLSLQNTPRNWPLFTNSIAIILFSATMSHLNFCSNFLNWFPLFHTVTPCLLQTAARSLKTIVRLCHFSAWNSVMTLHLDSKPRFIQYLSSLPVTQLSLMSYQSPLPHPPSSHWPLCFP